jgi:hypothetical protein
VQLDASKLDEAHKYKDSGKFTVSGLFYKGGEPKDATVNVTPFPENGKINHRYDIELSELEGANAKVEMWDDGFLTVLIPTAGAAPQFATSNQNIKAVTLPLPGGQGDSTCYFGKEILDGQVRFALCDLQGGTPRIAFVDAEAAAAASTAPEAAPAEAAPAAGSPAPSPAPAN